MSDGMPKSFDEDVGRRDDFAQDRARAQQRDAHLAGAARVQQVHALEDALLDALRQRGLNVVLVHHRDVIEDALVVREHALHAVVDDHGELVRIGRVVGDAVRHRGRVQQAVAVLVLQAFARERGAARPWRLTGIRACADRPRPSRSRRRAGSRTSSSRCRTAPCACRDSRRPCPPRSTNRWSPLR